MNGSIWLVWALVALCAVISIILLFGKGSFLIAGFNTAGKEEKGKYNVKKLCRVVGGGFAVITIILSISAFYRFELPHAISWLLPYGILTTVVFIGILANTICGAKSHKEGGR